jgi:hypothetical protein
MAERQQAQVPPEEKLGAIECESGNMEMQRSKIKKFVLDTVSDLASKV